MIAHSVLSISSKARRRDIAVPPHLIYDTSATATSGGGSMIRLDAANRKGILIVLTGASSLHPIRATSALSTS
jgi:hypothetical protein